MCVANSHSAIVWFFTIVLSSAVVLQTHYHVVVICQTLSYCKAMLLVEVSPSFSVAFSYAFNTSTEMRKDFGFPSWSGTPSHTEFLHALALLINSFTCMQASSLEQMHVIPILQVKPDLASS